MITNRSKSFSASNETLPFNTFVIATIRTSDDKTVYSKLYPHPMGASEFVNREIADLLLYSLFRTSRSPYNNPTNSLI